MIKINDIGANKEIKESVKCKNRPYIIKNICGREINVEHKILKADETREIKKVTQEIKNLVKQKYIKLNEPK